MNTLQDYQFALLAIFSNPHVDLGDLVYTIRERELEGWEGPAVKQWGDAVAAAHKLLKADGLLR